MLVAIFLLCLTLPATLPAAEPVPRKPCLPCDEEDANAQRGYPVRGRILGVDPERHQVLVKHREIPGVMRAMTMVFNVDPAVLPALKREQELLGRIEKRGKEWWLFNIKLLGASLRTSNAQRPTSNIERMDDHVGTTKIRHWMFDVGSWMLDVECPSLTSLP